MEISAILALISALPLLIQMIQSIVTGIENASNQAQATGVIEAPIAGADKLAAATNLFTALWPAISSTGTGAKLAAATTPDQLSSLVTMLINGTVSVFNQLGIFKPSATTTTTPTV